MALGMLQVDDEVAKVIDEWVKQARATPPKAGDLPLCAATEAGPRAYGSCLLGRGVMELDGLIGTPAGCEYVLAFVEEMARARGAVVYVRAISQGAETALDAAGYELFGPGKWIRDPFAAAPEEPEPQEAPGLDELDDDEDEDEDDLEDEPPPPPPPRPNRIQPRRQRRRKRK